MPLLTPYIRIFEKLSELFDREPVKFNPDGRPDPGMNEPLDPTDTSLPFDLSEDHVRAKELNSVLIGPYVAGDEPDIIVGYNPNHADDDQSTVSCRDYGFEIHLRRPCSELNGYPAEAIGYALANQLGIPFRTSAELDQMIRDQRMLRGNINASQARLELFEAECAILQHERQAGVLIIPDLVVQHVLYADNRLHTIDRAEFIRSV